MHDLKTIKSIFFQFRFKYAIGSFIFEVTEMVRSSENEFHSIPSGKAIVNLWRSWLSCLVMTCLELFLIKKTTWTINSIRRWKSWIKVDLKWPSWGFGRPTKDLPLAQENSFGKSLNNIFNQLWFNNELWYNNKNKI